MTFVYQPNSSDLQLELEAKYWVLQIQKELNKIWSSLPNVEIYADTGEIDRFGNRQMFLYAKERWTGTPISLSHVGNPTRKDAKWVSMNFNRGEPNAKWEAECIKRELQHYVAKKRAAEESK